MPRGYKNDVAELVRLKKLGWTLEQIAGHTKCRRGTIQALLRKEGFRKYNLDPLGEETEQKVVKDYLSGKSAITIAKQIGREFKIVYRLLKRKGIKRRNPSEASRKYALDELAFSDAENNPEAAYWVGFLMADGCVRVTNKGQHTVGLAITESDIGHVRKFRKFLRTNCPIDIFINNRGYANAKPLARLGVTSRVMFNDLVKYGVVPRKSKTAKVLLLEDNPHFWRGCVDGDGCIGFAKQSGCPFVGLTGAKELVSQFANFIYKKTGLVRKLERNNSIWKVGGCCHIGKKILNTLLYKNGNPSLTRKMKKARLAMKWYGKGRERI